MNYFTLIIFLIGLKSFNAIGQLDSTIIFLVNGYSYELNYKDAVTNFYTEKDSIEYYSKNGIENIIKFKNLKNHSKDSLGEYITGDSIIIGNNNFYFYHVLKFIEHDNKKVKIYSSTNELVKYKMKIIHKSEYTGTGIGDLTTEYKRIIDRKKRIIIFEDSMVVGLPC